MNPPADKKRMTFFIAAALLALLTAFFYLSKGRESQSGKTLSPYFSYSADELKPLADLQFSEETTPDDLISWEEKAFEMVGQTKSDATLTSKFYAYLWTARAISPRCHPSCLPKGREDFGETSGWSPAKWLASFSPNPALSFCRMKPTAIPKLLQMLSWPRSSSEWRRTRKRHSLTKLRREIPFGKGLEHLRG